MLKKLIMLVVVVGLTLPAIVYGQQVMKLRSRTVIQKAPLAIRPVQMRPVCPIIGCKKLNIWCSCQAATYDVGAVNCSRLFAGQNCATYDYLLRELPANAVNLCMGLMGDDSLRCYIQWSCAESCTVGE